MVIKDRLQLLTHMHPWMGQGQARFALCVAYFYATRIKEKEGAELEKFMDDITYQLQKISEDDFFEYFTTAGVDLEEDTELVEDDDEDDDYQRKLVAIGLKAGDDEKEFNRLWTDAFVFGDDY